jgi:hypothetical protein
MIRIILAGEFRGNESSWYSLFRMFSQSQQHVAIYAGSSSSWADFTVPHKFVTTTIDLESIFNQSQHCHRNRYISQWSALYQTYHAFEHEFAETDLIVKARNDLDIFDVFTQNVEENIIYVPEKEFHESKPFDTETVCNDQILIGTKRTMDIYFKLSRQYQWNNACDISVEEVLRQYLRQQNLELKTFPLQYSKNKG